MRIRNKSDHNALIPRALLPIISEQDFIINLIITRTYTL